MKRILMVFGLCAGLSWSATAIPIRIPGFGMDMPKNGTGGPTGANANDDPSNFFRLETVVNAWNLANPSQPLPTPVLTGAKDLDSASVGAGGLTGFSYAVLHYGKGPNGTGGGGGVEVFFLNGSSSFIFPSNGTGPNGFGGFSTLTLFGSSTVPEAATSIGLLTLGLAGLSVFRRLVKR